MNSDPVLSKQRKPAPFAKNVPNFNRDLHFSTTPGERPGKWEWNLFRNVIISVTCCLIVKRKLFGADEVINECCCRKKMTLFSLVGIIFHSLVMIFRVVSILLYRYRHFLPMVFRFWDFNFSDVGWWNWKLRKWTECSIVSIAQEFQWFEFRLLNLELIEITF